MSKNTITLNDIDTRLERFEDRLYKILDDHEERIRRGESFQNRTIGIIGVVATFSSVISTWIWDRLTGRNL